MTLRNSGAFAATSLALIGALCFPSVFAQDENPTTPGAIPDPSTYQGSTELQRQSDAQDQSYRNNAPGDGGAGGGGYSRNTGSAAGAALSMRAMRAPLLPPDRNALLGRWQQTAGRSTDLGGLNQLFPGLGETVTATLGGGCQSIFGKGRVAFTPTSFNWVAPDGHEELLNHVKYHDGGATKVFVISESLILVFDFPDHDHAVVNGLGCTMQRLGPGDKPTPDGQAKAAAQPVAARSQPAAPDVPAGQAILDFNVGATVAGNFSPAPAGTALWLTPQNPDTNLVKAGFTSDPGGQPIEKLFAACQIGHGGTAEGCKRGMQAMLTGALGVARTDTAGHARTGALAPGRYYVVGFVPYQGHSLMWHMPVDLKTGANSLSLGPQNGSISHAVSSAGSGR